jgi:hypothetical protein
MLIEIDIRSFWRAGTGAGEAGGIDALCALDHLGLPYLPGRHLKGLLRDAVTRAIALGHIKDVTVDMLFGQPGFRRHSDDLLACSLAKPGCLRVDSAHLPEADCRAILGSNDSTAMISQLFRTIQSTEMNECTGAAKNKSLRLEQVVLPLKLEFEVAGPEGVYEKAIETALPLIRAVGQKRTRGLGRAVFRCMS